MNTNFIPMWGNVGDQTSINFGNSPMQGMANSMFQMQASIMCQQSKAQLFHEFAKDWQGMTKDQHDKELAKPGIDCMSDWIHEQIKRVTNN